CFRSCPKSPQDDREQTAGCGVQENVDQMITDHRIIPQPVFDPERGVDDRVVLLGRIQLFARDRKSTRLNSSHVEISYAVFCWKKKLIDIRTSASPSAAITLVSTTADIL